MQPWPCAKLSIAPILATTDPLFQSVEAILGRWLSMKGHAGATPLVALVLTMLSIAALTRLRNKSPEGAAETRTQSATKVPEKSGEHAAPCQGRRAARRQRVRSPREMGRSGSPIMCQCPTNAADFVRERVRRAPGATLLEAELLSAYYSWRIGRCQCAAHIAYFVGERLQSAEGASVSAAELRSAYHSWCMVNGRKPVSGHRLGAALRELGFVKWKSCGRIRYRDLQLRLVLGGRCQGWPDRRLLGRPLEELARSA